MEGEGCVVRVPAESSFNSLLRSLFFSRSLFTLLFSASRAPLPPLQLCSPCAPPVWPPHPRSYCGAAGLAGPSVSCEESRKRETRDEDRLSRPDLFLAQAYGGTAANARRGLSRPSARTCYLRVRLDPSSPSPRPSPLSPGSSSSDKSTSSSSPALPHIVIASCLMLGALQARHLWNERATGAGGGGGAGGVEGKA